MTLSPATRAAVLKALADAVGEEYKTARAAADDGLRELHTAHGVTSVEIRLDQPIGVVAKLTLSAPEGAVAIDEPGLLAWCQREHPAAVVVETTHHVVPAFRRQLLTRLELQPDGKVVDTTTGEIVQWARGVPAGPPRTTMTFVKDGRDGIAWAWRQGELGLPELLALETPAE